MLLSTNGRSWTRWRMARAAHPTRSPRATPSTALQTSSVPARVSEKVSVTTAATAMRYATSAVASLKIPSPSSTAVTAGGTRSGRITAIAATGSGDETIAPRTYAAGQVYPGRKACAAAATATMVTSTSGTESWKIGQNWRLNSRSGAVDEAR